ncbi:MAG: permease-like cell division protein FtsX [Clostridium sp.]
MNNKIGYYLNEGYINLLKNKKRTFGSIFVMFCTLFIFGAFLIVSLNLNKGIETLKKDQGMQVFIKDGISEAEKNELERKIREIPEVNPPEFKSREQAFEDLKKQSKEQQDLLEGFTDGRFLPDSFIVKLNNLNRIKEVKAQIEKFDNVAGIEEQENLIAIILSISKIITTIGVTITVVLVIFSVSLIATTIKLTMDIRRREISIMKYVGATDAFIRGPFIVEGMLIGLISTFLVVLTIIGVYEMILIQIPKIISQTASKIGTQQVSIQLLPMAELLPILLIVFLVLSLGLGIIGSTISMKKYLEV